MQRKLLGIISVNFNVTGQLLITYSAFIKYLRERERKKGLQESSPSAIYGLKETLSFS